MKEIILEEKIEYLGETIPRKFKMESLRGKATILMGVRRSGKSTLLRQYMRQQKQPYFYINFSDERISSLPAKELGLVLEAFYELEPELENKDILLGFDEIQVIAGWEYFIDRLVRNKHFQVMITGSSAKMLSQDIATEMRGRALTYEFFPFSFSEYIFPLAVNPAQLTTQTRSKLVILSKKYLLEGGYPEVRNLAGELRVRILQEYYNTIFYKDVIERFNADNPHAVSVCLKILINQVASLYSITKISNKCKSLGVKVSKSDVGDFIKWFEDCYLLFSVPIFAESINRQMTNPRKIYCIDNGLVRANQAGVSANSGHLLENLVFNCLRRKTAKIFYYKEEHEVDFIFQTPDHKLMLLQVCESLEDPATKKREIIALCEAMSRLKIKKSWIVTLEEKSVEKVKEGHIHIMPLWEFALKFPKL